MANLHVWTCIRRQDFYWL